MAAHFGFPLFLPDDTHFRSQALLDDDVVKSIAGRARVAYELAAGENPFPQEPPATPRNPQGLLGVDLSGPPWGSAVLHPVAWGGGRSANSSIAGERGFMEGIETTWKQSTPWIFWHRPHAQLPAPAVAPYDRLYVQMYASIASGVNVTLSMILQTLDLDRGTVIVEETDTFTLSTTVTAFLSTKFFGDLRGGHQAVRIVCKTNAAAGQVATIHSVMLCNIVKRSH